MTAEHLLHQPPEPLAADIRAHWLLDPDVTFLNHGSFGATPIAILQTQQRLREEMERQPILWLDRKRQGMIDTALETIGEFVGADGANLGFVTNATEGVTAVSRSLTFEPNDEIITAAHAYDAVRNTLAHVAKRTGANLNILPIDLPFNAQHLTDGLERAFSPRTKLVVLDHISSPSAIVFPVSDIAELCADRGVELLVDGAHAPGMLDLDIESIGPAYYTGNCHKWICAPKGAGILYVSPDRRERIQPSIISNYAGEGFRAEFGWQGTRDITPWLSVPEAIQFFERRFGWSRVREHNHQLAVWAHAMIAERWPIDPIVPLDGSCTGSMFTIPLPDRANDLPDRHAAQALLFDRYHIEVPVFPVNGRLMIRPSCQLYNRPEEYERLANAVLELFG